MSSSNTPSDPKKLPVAYQPKPIGDAYHTNEWSSGSRGGGKVPSTFSWATNPKQNQEERGAGEVEQDVKR